LKHSIPPDSPPLIHAWLGRQIKEHDSNPSDPKILVANTKKELERDMNFYESVYQIYPVQLAFEVRKKAPLRLKSIIEQFESSASTPNDKEFVNFLGVVRWTEFQHAIEDSEE
jgi:hypothetical protein